MNVFDLAAKITLDDSSYESGLKKASTNGKEVASKIGGGLKTVGKVGVAAFGAVTAGATALGGVMSKITKTTIAYGDSVDKNSQKMGLSAEAYQEWDAIMKHCGTSIDALKPSMKTLSVQAQKNSKAFQQLGISQQEVATLSKEELFKKTIEGLQNMEEGTERTALASQLLGRGATELGALLNTSAAKTEEMRNKVHELGGVMSDEAVKGAAAMQDSIQDMQTAFEGIKRNLGSFLIPQFKVFVDFASTGISKITEAFNKSGLNAAMQEFGNFISEGLTKLIEKAPDMVKQGVSLIKGIAQGITKNKKAVGDAISELVISVAEALPDIIDSIVTLVGSLIEQLANNAERIIGSILNAIETVIDKLLEKGADGKSKIASIIDSIVKLVMGAISAILDDLPTLIPKLVDIAVEVIQEIFKNVKEIFKKFPDFISSIIKGITSGINEILKNMPNLLTELISMLIEILPDLLSGTITGIVNLVAAVIKMLPDLIWLPFNVISQLIGRFGSQTGLNTTPPPKKKTDKELLNDTGPFSGSNRPNLRNNSNNRKSGLTSSPVGADNYLFARNNANNRKSGLTSSPVGADNYLFGRGNLGKTRRNLSEILQSVFEPILEDDYEDDYVTENIEVQTPEQPIRTVNIEINNPKVSEESDIDRLAERMNEELGKMFRVEATAYG